MTPAVRAARLDRIICPCKSSIENYIQKKALEEWKERHDVSQFLVICRTSGNSMLAVYFTYHRVSDALEWAQLSQFTLTFPTREWGKRIQTVLVLTFIEFLSFGTYSDTGILGSTLSRRKQTETYVEKNQANRPIIYQTFQKECIPGRNSFAENELSRKGPRYPWGDVQPHFAISPSAVVVPCFVPLTLGYVAFSQVKIVRWWSWIKAKRWNDWLKFRCHYLNLSRWACRIGSKVAAVSESPGNPPAPGEIPAEELLPSMLTSFTASATQSLAFAWPCNNFQQIKSWHVWILSEWKNMYIFASP